MTRAWQANAEAFGSARAVALMNGKRQEEDTVVAAAQLHLLDYEFPEMLTVLFPDRVVFVTSAKKRA